MTYTEIVSLIEASFLTGEPKNVTAEKIRTAFLEVVGFANVTQGDYQGTAAPTDDPGIPAGPVYYFANSAGTYTNFGGLVVADGFNILSYDGAVWSKSVVPIDLSGYATSIDVSDLGNTVSKKADKLTGKNLFNINDSGNVLGMFVSSSTGELAGGSAYNATHFIEITAGLTYTLSYKHQIAWYDENKTYISGSSSSDTTRSQAAPATAKYLRASVATASWPSFQVEEGTVQTAFEPFVLSGLEDFARTVELGSYAKLSSFDQTDEVPFVNTYLKDVASSSEIPTFSEEYAGWESTGSVFSGWGSPIGMPENFNSVRIKIRARATEITQVRFRVFAGDSYGPVLADKTVGVSVMPYDTKDITCVFDAIIDNPTADKLYLFWQCNQLVDRFGIDSRSIFPVSEGHGAPRYETNGDMDGLGGFSVSAEERTYVVMAVSDPVVGFSETFIGYLQMKLGMIEGFTPSAEILLPTMLYAAEGVELNVFWDNIIFSNYPLSKLQINVTCTVGAQLERGWRYTPLASSANLSFSISVSFDGVELASASSTIVTKGAVDGAAAMKALCIGDSTTAGGQYISIINTDYNANPAVTFLGTQGSGLNLHEGYGGKTFSFFTSSSSPFWNASTSQIDFQNYLTVNGWSMAATDLISIHLGINDVFHGAEEAKLNGIKADCDALIAEFRRVVPGINVAVCVTIPPTISQDGFASSYQNDYDLNTYLTRYRAWVKFILANYDTLDNRTNKVFMPQFNCNLDRTFNFPQSEVVANSRTAKTVTKWTNGVHPDTEGYYQMGDVLWAFIKSL